ncbi:RNA polymerase, sigma subunit, ECF family [Friedmanniella luteola]|uniref:RNA polymerase, sigma subunit, ECF family n=1 Tax=Friedmanniella luteola TaxID=546871 RepID=A0A1H1L603_9ACTN|nr:DUF6596 domain-containing protein [Friedmanniella luteola]SDR69770.1 RNA polymerase, sigma subunit, ECF family [Friedmanniella luteola]
MTDRALVEAALAQAHRAEWAYVVAATLRTVRDLDLAEECVQEAYTAALQSWRREGIPASPAAWLTTTARRRGIDAVRRDQTLKAKLPLLVEPHLTSPEGEADMEPRLQDETTVPDERLRLVFLCCHPALAVEAQVALTLRLVCGVDTVDIARAFLVPATTMAARITRAKKKITGSRIPFRLPSAAELPDRLDGVLGVVHLLFTTGYTAPTGSSVVRADLVDAALRLAETLRELLPDEPEVAGLLALLLAADARRAARTDEHGQLIQLRDQDPTRWDHLALRRAHQLVMAALPHPRAGRHTLQAAIACQHAVARDGRTTDWAQILGLYDALLQVWPSPVVALNRAVALAEIAGPAAALAEVRTLDQEGRLAGYHYLHAVEADLLHRLDRPAEARDAYQRARSLTDNAAEQRFLERQIAALE